MNHVKNFEFNYKGNLEMLGFETERHGNLKSLEWTRSLKCLPLAEVCDSSILIAKFNTKIQ